MQILVINSGSSSIKFQLFKMPAGEVVCSGMVERIGLDNAVVHYKAGKIKLDDIEKIEDHQQGLAAIAKRILDRNTGVIRSASEIDAVGHRVVHGGSSFSKTTIITDEVKGIIRELSSLAPLHNPANLEGIEVSEKIFPEAKQVAVFDTAFHQTIPVEAHKYALPNELYESGIRVYGFHGTSHKFVSEKANKYLGKKESKIVTIHLGNGCSMTAIKDGKSIDHTLGFSPVSGLIMGTRSGDIDPAIVFHLVKSEGYTLEQVNNMLQKKSGMLGLTGYSDLREIEEKAVAGDEKCQEALVLNAYRIKRFIGAYAAIMNGLDAIVFTAGIGENSENMRRLVGKNMSYLGIEIDGDLNSKRAKGIREISIAGAKTKVLIVPTDEEAEIAKQTFECL